jgi:uncharacterized protein YjbI with pentapeptide repeats
MLSAYVDDQRNSGRWHHDGVIRDIEGEPRTRAEMRFAVSVIPCPDCGTAETAEPSVQGTVYRPVYVWTCSGCGAERGYRFHYPATRPNLDAAPPAQLGGPEPSRIIAPDALAAEVRRLTPLVPAEPGSLDPDTWKAAYDRMNRLRVCLNELAKFPGHDVAADRAWLEATTARYRADLPRYHARRQWMYPPRPAAVGTIDRDSVRAHELWERQGCTGPGQLDVAHVDARNLPFGACNLRLSRFTGILMEGANAESSTFAEAVWTRVYARGARLQSTTWDGARLEDCELYQAGVDLGRLRQTTVTGGDWDGVRLERALLNDAVFEGVSLREARLVDARLDGASFVDCDLRGADLSVDLDYLSLGTNVGTRFVDCDLRGTVVTGRRDLEL